MQDIEQLRTWIGRTEEAEDTLTPRHHAATLATLNLDLPWPEAGTPILPGWHWTYFTPVARTDALDSDGHEELGHFLPPIELPRRMWAGGRIEFLAPLRVGETGRRVSTVTDITAKQGRSGKLIFALVGHEIHVGGEVRLREERTIVYREAPKGGDTPPEPPAAPDGADFTKEIRPTPDMLFRYSALTFNSHKIHLDRDYCRRVEAYPGLVVHGPLTATLLLDVVREAAPEAVVAEFTFRAISPLFDIAPFTVNGRLKDDGAMELWAANDTGGLAMTAEAKLA